MLVRDYGPKRTNGKPAAWKAAPKSGFWQHLVAQLPVAMAATDGDFRVTAWNLSCERLLGMPAAKMLGESILIVLPEARRWCLATFGSARAVDDGATSRFNWVAPARPGGAY